MAIFNAYDIRKDFPCLDQTVYDKPFVFLDTAASAQKPNAVIDRMTQFYQKEYANIHRGLYYLSNNATQHFEEVREQAARFLNAKHSNEIVFVRGATEGINLVAQSYGTSQLKEGDEIIISTLEHHANIVPWQMLRDKIGITLKIIPINDAGEILFEAYQKLLTPRTKLVALNHMSNALGSITPVKDYIQAAHDIGAIVLIDGCQSAVHLDVDVQALDADFYVFSGHKLYGPSGIGVLYGKETLLNAMPPYHGGGEMIDQVTFEHTTYREAPLRFEAGTPAIANVIGLGAAFNYLAALDRDAITAHEKTLLDYATEAINALPGFTLIGTAAQKAGVISFIHQEAHPNDIGTILDHSGIAIRTGHHCAQPLLQRLNVTATARMSLGIYNVKEDIDAFIDGLKKVNKMFGVS